MTNTELHFRQRQSHFSFHLYCSFTLLNQFDQSLLGKKTVVKLKSTRRFGKILHLYYGNGTSASILKLRTSCCPGDINKPLEFKNHDEVPLPNSIVFYRQLRSSPCFQCTQYIYTLNTGVECSSFTVVKTQVVSRKGGKIQTKQTKHENK